MGKNPTKRLAILNSAEHVFAERGFHEATISDIAAGAKVSDATIYEYFPSKEALLFAIPAEYSLNFQEQNRYVLKYINGQANKLRAIVLRLLELYQDHPEYANVIIMILKTSRKFTETNEYDVIRQSAQLMRKIIEDGMASGEFRSDLNPAIVRSMMLGTIEHLVVRKAILGKPENLVEQADSVVSVLFNGVLEPPEESAIKINLTLQKKTRGQDGQAEIKDSE
ncbi:MAG: TetR/AcrR family transcriptional regulator [Desulfarculaceae bacterium]|nr:TetR/AcrR family transcriptional regulator [Desulfarculaceae bacterium]MCF8073142.1 TetR/AcrR family transcriptional regulator [Desulfarculaceae bacterium]MCF8101773.1 TetR/AcrR family transcriptional regulator [Desulfarculaceae bacterium]MCF8117337.1 TetR/AcrR family transcriptional regulator [Desulfarculaceae bacterium]